MKVFVEFVLRLIFVDLKLSQNPYMPTTRITSRICGPESKEQQQQENKTKNHKKVSITIRFFHTFTRQKETFYSYAGMDFPRLGKKKRLLF